MSSKKIALSTPRNLKTNSFNNTLHSTSKFATDFIRVEIKKQDPGREVWIRIKQNVMGNQQRFIKHSLWPPENQRKKDIPRQRQAGSGTAQTTLTWDQEGCASRGDGMMKGTGYEGK